MADDISEVWTCYTALMLFLVGMLLSVETSLKCFGILLKRALIPKQ